LTIARPAHAITFGEIDSENRFPNAGAIVNVSDPKNPTIVGSGVLIHPRILLTAGHTTAAAEDAIKRGLIRLEDGRVSFGTDAFDSTTWREIEAIMTHPGFFTNSEAHVQDVGVVILKKPVKLPIARIAGEGLLDDLKDAGLLVNQGVRERFLTVGYGATIDVSPPEQLTIDGLRRFVFSDYRTLEGVWLYLNENIATGNGGGAPGDSGGPVFWVDPNGDLVLVALHAQGNLVSFASAYRLDTAEAQNFIDVVIALVDDR
jgi:hypothetical protein